MTETLEIKEPVEAAETVEQETAKPYTFRKLASDDLFLMCTIIKKIGLREFKTLFEGDNLSKLMALFKETKTDDEMLVELGGVVFEAIEIVIGNLPRCKEEIYQLLSQTSDLTVDAIRADALMFTEMLIDFFKKEEFPAFIKVVSKLFR